MSVTNCFFYNEFRITNGYLFHKKWKTEIYNPVVVLSVYLITIVAIYINYSELDINCH